MLARLCSVPHIDWRMQPLNQRSLVFEMLFAASYFAEWRAKIWAHNEKTSVAWCARVV